MLETIITVALVILVSVACVTFMVYITNRSRWTQEQAVQLSGVPEHEIRELTQERLIRPRRKYVVRGPLSFDRYELAQARDVYPKIKAIRAETDASIRKFAEDMAESKRFYQEQARLQQEETERMRRVHAEILKRLRADLNLIPQEIVEALQLLELTEDASFEKVQQQYRLLAKQYHPDAGGDHTKFIQINEAYKRVTIWIKSQD